MSLNCSSPMDPRSQFAVRLPRDASMDIIMSPNSQNQIGSDGDPKERIRRLLQKVEISSSAYDTAWAAMVPSPPAAYSQQRQQGVVPHFPECVNWILENQLKDGSWGLQLPDSRHPRLVKDTLSSTLACVLALTQWGIGEQLIHSALGFMERNRGSLSDPRQWDPVGFDVIFPAMIHTAGTQNLNLNHHLLLGNRESAPSPASGGRNAYLAYISEGLGASQDWGTTMKFQRKNGSLFNSPSATAAAAIHLRDADSLRYLRSIVDPMKGAVPSIYPHGIMARLCAIDNIKHLGIDLHFQVEIKQALDDIYTSWRQGDEEIFLDCATCAMAFRILRLSGYRLSPYALTRYTEDGFWSDTLEGYLKDEKAVLELYRASRIMYHDASVLENQMCWTRDFLMQLTDPESCQNYDVHDVLNYPLYVELEPMAYKRNIEQYLTDNTRMLKSSYSCANFGGGFFLKPAVDEYNAQQSLHLKKLEHLMQWLQEHKLDEMRVAKMKMNYCYFNSVTTFCDPSLAEARIAFSKSTVLVSLIDDLFDIHGTREEHLNIIQLFERWDVDRPKVDFCSEAVETLYWAIHSTLCETVEKAFPTQGRSVMDHVVELWLDMLKAMFKEAEWSRTNTVPAFDEYITNATLTIGLGPFLVPALYLVGHRLSEDAVKGTQFCRLFNVTALGCRLFNDIRGFEREAEQGKVNAVSLQSIDQNNNAEQVIKQTEIWIKNLNREVLRMSMDEKDYGVPDAVRDVFWKFVKGLYLFYAKEDLYFNSTKLIKVVESIIKEPLNPPIAT
ncbi:unnamed protein product [Linum trigynum]|uniref:Ent-kaurene synthase n=1 Tax=Linum trigynum TaxID=586398 RepID=A0AAV2FUX1_9ROSI